MFAFENAGDPVVYIGSADMMHRNLDRRIEALVQIKDPRHIKYLLDMFTIYMSDSSRTGTWPRTAPGPVTTPIARASPCRMCSPTCVRARVRTWIRSRPVSSLPQGAPLPTRTVGSGAPSSCVGLPVPARPPDITRMQPGCKGEQKVTSR